MLSLKPTFSLSSFAFIKGLFSSSLLSAIRVLSSAYLRLLIFLPAILIPYCASSSPAFLIRYTAYNLNKHGENIHTRHTPFPIGNQSVTPCPVLTVAPYLHTDFSRGKSGGLVFPSLSEFPSLLWSTRIRFIYLRGKPTLLEFSAEELRGQNRKRGKWETTNGKWWRLGWNSERKEKEEESGCFCTPLAFSLLVILMPPQTTLTPALTWAETDQWTCSLRDQEQRSSQVHLVKKKWGYYS